MKETETNWNFDLKEMIKAGVHLGHQTQKLNPKMAPYVFTQKRGIHIIHLPKTVNCLVEACEFLRDAASKKKQFLLIGTNTNYQVADLVVAAAQKNRCHYVNEKWLGGMLTNWSTTKTRLQRLRNLEAQEIANIFNRLPKKESAILKKKLNQLRIDLNGIKYMRKIPDVVIIVDQEKNIKAIQECIKLGIPTICLVDTDCNPELTDMPIPANNDSRGSIIWILEKLTLAIRKGRARTVGNI